MTPPSSPRLAPGLTERALRAQAQTWLGAGRAAMVLRITRVKGSTPRNAQTRMLIDAHQQLGTLGGGQLEWEATAWAREHLARPAGPPAVEPLRRTFALGPTLGQCCGGWLEVEMAPLLPQTLLEWKAPAPRLQVDVHGAGHVGQAIVRLLRTLDADVRWIDERLPETDPPAENDALALCPTEDAPFEARSAAPGRCHLVLTHRHDLDLAIVHELLQRPDVQAGQAWVGMIGSATKRATFEHRLAARGHTPEVLARLVSPIGLPGLVGKEPEVVAVAVVAQLLMLAPP